MVTAVEQLGEEVAAAAAAELWPLSDGDLAGWLRAARRIEQAAVVLQARLIRQADRRAVPGSCGYRSMTGWLRAVLLLDGRPARSLVESAVAVGRLPLVEQAVLDGQVDWRQATVIAAAVGAIPADLAEVDTAGAARGGTIAAGADAAGAAGGMGAAGDDTGLSAVGYDPPDGEAAGAGNADVGAVEGHIIDRSGVDGSGGEVAGPGEADAEGIAVRAERVLIGMAGRLTAVQLNQVGGRILSHVAPELAERADQLWLARQEARAHTRRALTLSAPVDGMVRVTGVLSSEDAATVRAALHPLCTPAPGDDRTPGQRRADALMDLCRLALRAGELPEQGGQPAQVAVTVSYDPLARALGVGTTDTGERLSADVVRRLACDARILPYVLGGAGQVLDVGRSRRLATAQLRRALAVRDRGCAFPDCDRPPGWSDAHHLIGWIAGGPTSLGNLTLLCRMHHRLIHDRAAGWRIEMAPDGIPDFIPPPHIDPQQNPRRNLYHLRQ